MEQKNKSIKQNKKNSLLRYAFTSTIPVMVGYIFLGAAFGILLEDKGYDFIWAFIMSTFVYAGSMQFVAVNLLGSGAAFISVALMTLLINARHIIYGITMLGKYKGTGKIKPYLIFSLSDETFALLCNDPPEWVNRKKYYLLVSVMDQLYWIAGSVAGSLIGSVIKFDTTGIDFAMTALFIVIFVKQWMNSKDRFPAIIGIGITAVCLIVFGADNFMIPSMLMIVAALTIYEIAKERRVHDEYDNS